MLFLLTLDKMFKIWLTGFVRFFEYALHLRLKNSVLFMLTLVVWLAHMRGWYASMNGMCYVFVQVVCHRVCRVWKVCVCSMLHEWCASGCVSDRQEWVA